MVSCQDVLEARIRIQKYIYNTPLQLSFSLSNKNTKVYLKLESQQRVNSFKIRGALSKLTSLTQEEKERGILAVSSGNHGAGVSYAAYLLGGIKAQIFVPKTAPKAKIEKIKYYGADVNVIGEIYDETHVIADEALKKGNMTYVDPCSDVEVIAGQGTIGLEILEEKPDLDMIIIPIGGGGLITGIGVAAKHLKPSIKIIGVQTEACPAMVHSLKDKEFYGEYPAKPSICDALVGGVGEIPYNMAMECIDDIIEVKEEMIKKAVAYLINEEKVISEPAGAVGVAAIMNNPDYFVDKNVAVIISGGNIDNNLMKEILMDE